MTIFSSRMLERPTIIGRERALTVFGNSRFARIANLTGTEVLLKVEKAAGRLAEKAIDWFNFRWPRPGYAFAGAEGTAILERIERVEVTAAICRAATIGGRDENSAGTNVKGAQVDVGNIAGGQKALKTDEDEIEKILADCIKKRQEFDKEIVRFTKRAAVGCGIGISIAGCGMALSCLNVSALNNAAPLLIWGGWALALGIAILDSIIFLIATKRHIK